MTAPPRGRVLCVDDEPLMLESLEDSLRRRFDVETTTNGFEALRMLSGGDYDVVLSDLRMPMINGARFLTLAREHAPETVRVMLTGGSKVDDAAAAVNEGEIFRFLMKPCSRRDLIEALDSAVTRREAIVQERTEREQTLRETVRSFCELAARVDPDGPARGEYVRKLAVMLATEAGVVTPLWELERACELMALGALALPAELRADLARDRRLPQDRVTELEHLPGLAAPFLRRIPRLGPIAALLQGAADALVPMVHGVAGTPPASRVLRIALDFGLLEREGVPAETVMESLRSRADRYDPQLLDAFDQLVRRRDR